MQMSCEERTRREYRLRICRAMDYISRHLGENPSLEEIAQAAPFSKFHFHRIFSAIVGETVAQFTRRLRLEKAAHHLLYDRERDVTSIAFDCGFSSSQNFATAFRKHFGQSPTEFRLQFRKQTNADRKNENAFAWPPSYDPDVVDWPERSEEGRRAVKVEIKEMPEYHVAYVRHIGPYGPEGCGGAFERLMRWAGPRGLAKAGITIGVSWDNPEITPPEKCRYDACVPVPPGTATEGEVGLQTLPGGTHAVCRCTVALNEFGAAWAEFMRGWLPGSGYQPGEGAAYELYPSPGPGPDGKWTVDLCFPVRPL
jgi:AraC family transcriptional regulator